MAEKIESRDEPTLTMGNQLCPTSEYLFCEKRDLFTSLKVERQNQNKDLSTFFEEDFRDFRRGSEMSGGSDDEDGEAEVAVVVSGRSSR